MSELESRSPSEVVASVGELGQILRSKRRSLGFTLEQVAGLSGIGIRYLSELERGKQTIEMGKALNVASCLGLEIVVRPRLGARRRSCDE
jgi:transcriptional regulator with XRE-family HTH domain